MMLKDAVQHPADLLAVGIANAVVAFYIFI